MAEHGTRGRYREGCRCAKCKSVNSAYNRQWYINGKRPGSGDEKVKPAGPGPVEIATEAQLAGLSGAAAQPALAAGALALARLLDSDRTPSAHPQAMKQLADVLERLRKGSELRRSGLASVRSMTRPSDEAATG